MINMISEEVREVMNIIIASVDEQFTNNEHVNKFFNTKTTFYDFISKYFNELADNERTKSESDYCEEKNKPRHMNCIEAMMQNIDFMMRRCEQNSSQEEVTEAIYLFLDSR